MGRRDNVATNMEFFRTKHNIHLAVSMSTEECSHSLSVVISYVAT